MATYRRRKKRRYVLNNWNSRLRREGAMARFRDIKTLQKFVAVHASIYNHFNHQRSLNRRQIFNQLRATALAEWRELAA